MLLRVAYQPASGPFHRTPPLHLRTKPHLRSKLGLRTESFDRGMTGTLRRAIAPILIAVGMLTVATAWPTARLHAADAAPAAVANQALRRLNMPKDAVPGLEPESPGQSAAVVVDDVPLIHTAQLLPILDPTDPALPATVIQGDTAAQIARVYERLDQVLRSAGSSSGHIVKLNVYVANAAVAAAVRADLSKRFSSAPPAVCWVETTLPLADAVFAVDAVAAAPANLNANSGANSGANLNANSGAKAGANLENRPTGSSGAHAAASKPLSSDADSAAGSPASVPTPSTTGVAGLGVAGPGVAGPGVAIVKHAAITPAGPRVYVAGQAEKGDLRTATRKTLESLDATLKFLRLEWADVAQVKSFVTPMTAVRDAEDESRRFFAGRNVPVPPLVWVQWQSGLPIEIELVAAAGRSQPNAAKATRPPDVEFLTPPGMTTPTIYSRVTRTPAGPTIFVSGLYGSPQSSGGDQVERIFGQLKAVLAAADSDFEQLAKATYYVSDNDASAKLNELRPRYYNPRRPPAASKAQVAGVALPGATITLDMIAVPRAKR